ERNAGLCLRQDVRNLRFGVSGFLHRVGPSLYQKFPTAFGLVFRSHVIEFFVLVPFWAALELVREGRLWVSLIVGWIYWTVAEAGGSYWMHSVVMEFSGYGPLASAALVMGALLHLGGQYAVLGLLYAAVRRRGWSVGVAAVPTFVVVEWLYPTWFPVYLSNGLVLVPLLVQTADLGGVLLVTAFLVSINLLVFELLRWALGRRRTPVRVAIFCISFLGFAMAYGAVRIAQMDARAGVAPTVEVGVVQANVGIEEGQKDPAGGHRKHVSLSRQLETEGRVDLLVWPESSYRYPTFERNLPLLAPEVRTRRLKSPLLFGGISGTQHEGVYSELHNTVFFVDEEDVVSQAYDKVELLAFGEYVPLGKLFPILLELTPNTGKYDRGHHLEPFRVGPWKVSTPICYEDSLPRFMRKMVNHANPHLLLNLTNDAWFGDSFGALLHYRMAQFRAIEHRRYLVRATNTGVGGVIDPVGRALIETDIQQPATFRATVGMMDGTTVYGRFGDWPGWLSLIVTLFLLVRRGTEHQ
ncbi:MAG: apolipoprotein N-acyltransferase, partial [Myxococcota bacterium]